MTTQLWTSALKRQVMKARPEKEGRQERKAQKARKKTKRVPQKPTMETFSKKRT